MRKLNAAVVGATGIAGQQFLAALDGHPLFEVTAVAASQRSAGKHYLDAIRTPAGAVQWFCRESLPESCIGLRVEDAAAFDSTQVDIVFAALESEAARELEPRYARHVPVISTASAFRMEGDVPILVPGVNPGHIPLIRSMQQRRGWKGFVAPNPNCTAVGLVITLAPLQEAFGIRSVLVTSMQAVSGAGRAPGVVGLDIIDNVVPHISKEEAKVEAETRKVLGTLTDAGIAQAEFPVSATCTRVPVLEGHTECVNVSLRRPARPAEVKEAFVSFGREFTELRHHSSPRRMITVLEDTFRPQPRLDRDNEDGMTTTVGRLRECPVLPDGIKYVLVSHNTRMGAAKGAVLMAEELIRQGYIP